MWRELKGALLLPFWLAREGYLLATECEFVLIPIEHWRPGDTWKTLRAKSLHSWRSSEQGKSSRTIEDTRQCRDQWEQSCLAGRLVRLWRESASGGSTVYRLFPPDCGDQQLADRLRSRPQFPLRVSYGGGRVVVDFQPCDWETLDFPENLLFYPDYRLPAVGWQDAGEDTAMWWHRQSLRACGLPYLARRRGGRYHNTGDSVVMLVGV